MKKNGGKFVIVLAVIAAAIAFHVYTSNQAEAQVSRPATATLVVTAGTGACQVWAARSNGRNIHISNCHIAVD